MVAQGTENLAEGADPGIPPTHTPELHWTKEMQLSSLKIAINN